jgi:hypothetical protein
MAHYRLELGEEGLPCWLYPHDRPFGCLRGPTYLFDLLEKILDGRQEATPTDSL